MSSKISIWRKVPGYVGRYNDVIYSRPLMSVTPPSQDVLLYFGGDIQDLQENMEKTDNKVHKKWCLENTAEILSTNFPKKHVLVVRPSRITVNTFSCFDNFVPSNECGVPTFLPMHNALKHLLELVKSCLIHIKACTTDQDPICFTIENTKLTLLGFSKGCVVLNQLLHEFHYYQSEQNLDVEIDDFLRLIESMWWLDGGHAGSKDTWITEPLILESLKKLGIDVHVHVTPYQVQDFHRQWIREEEHHFCTILRNIGVPVKRILHFADKSRSLKHHFNVLKAIRNYT
ncbi:UPF0565 protein C2orf69 homolog [Ceratina calcarata]|uniref:UPF0565 protein C2orf69 homolog n=1 Tax=Ceratina calcarata TaxID=156304 RepID=A0AAJ7J297_9HYME|nr:UPF0565 protein C2orf69 homolog [Ceratina calcarata]